MAITSDERIIIEEMIDYLHKCNIEKVLDLSVDALDAVDFDDYCEEEVVNEYSIVDGCTHGATKAVFMSGQLPNWILKVPFYFSHPVRDYQKDFDFCKIEVKNYNLAKKAGLEKYFAEEVYIGTFYGMDIYAQRMADCDPIEFEDDFRSYASSNYDIEDFDSKDDYENTISYEVEDMNEEDSLYAIYGDDSEIEDLIKFVYDNDINDLHSGNFGYIDDEPVLIDYSGYN